MNDRHKLLWKPRAIPLADLPLGITRHYIPTPDGKLEILSAQPPIAAAQNGPHLPTWRLWLRCCLTSIHDVLLRKRISLLCTLMAGPWCKLEAWLLSNDLGDGAMLSPGLKDLKLAKRDRP
jgi:hypothetical protein